MVDDEPLARRGLARLLTGYRVHLAGAVEQARVIMTRRPEISAIICDYQLAEGATGLAVLDAACLLLPRVRRVLITGHDLGPLWSHVDSGLVHVLLDKADCTPRRLRAAIGEGSAP